MPNATPVIVVLDDEPDIQKALRRLLTSKGFVVETYGRGEDLIAALDSHRIDCLLLDLHMAGVNGFDVLEAFQSRHIRVPVVVITGHDEPSTEARARSLGAAEYLKKPVDRAALLSAIHSAIAGNHDQPA